MDPPLSDSTLAILLATRWQEHGSQMRASWQGHGRPRHFVMSTFLPDFTYFRDSACLLLPGLQRVDS